MTTQTQTQTQTFTRSTDRFLLLVVFLAGIGTLGIEMVMPRLLAPFFGTSQPIWAVVIGSTLTYLAIGYRLGGTLADRNPDERLLYRLIAWAGLLTALIPLVADPILRTAQQALVNLAPGGFVGALVGVVLLFAAPVILMAMVGPFAIRLQIRRLEEGIAAAGRTAGSISAVSTVGSILGTFLTVLVLIPAIGSDRTLFLFAGFLVGLGIIGLRDWRYLWMFAVVALLAFLTLSTNPVIKAADCYRCTLIAETESRYNYIQVARQERADPNMPPDPRMVLILNEGRAIHSAYRLNYRVSGDPLDLLTFGGPWDYFSVAPYFYANRDPQSVTSMALLGSAAGTIPKQFLAIYGPETRVDAVEIDPEIIDMGRRYFDMEDQDPQFPNYSVYAQDARYWLATSGGRYDVIGMDAYHQPYIPFHLTTVEFFSEVRAHLTDDGVAVVNVGRAPNGDETLINAIAGTMRTVFPQVFVIDSLGRSNAILVGVNRPVGDGVGNFIANYEQIDEPALRQVMEWSFALYTDETRDPIREFNPADAPLPPLTDDRAPVEQLIDLMILDELR